MICLRYFTLLSAWHGAATALGVLNIGRPSETDHLFHLESVPGHSLYIRQTDESICAGNEGVAGYLNVEQTDKHFSFWAFESRNDPENDPLILWMTGGPGCSSIGVGMLVELGPCLIQDSSSTVYNPYSWNSNATVIFVDQPANVGYSYSKEVVENLYDSTTDMHNFLKLWFAAFPKLADRDFYIAGESYGGSWVPDLAARIQERQFSPMAQAVLDTSLTTSRPINLKGIMLGNAQVAQRDQWKGFYDTGCLGDQPLFNESICATIQLSAKRCESLLEVCSMVNYDQAVCGPILAECREQSVFFIQKAGLNPYDFRQPCGEDPHCYPEMTVAETYMNSAKVKTALGVDSDRTFKQCTDQIAEDFVKSGDVGKETTRQVSYLLESGIDVLVYVGNKDWYCNAAGMRYFVDNLVWEGLAGFRSLSTKAWTVDQQIAGSYKSWTHLTFVEIFDAGHMVPLNKPLHSLGLINRWIGRTELAW